MFIVRFHFVEEGSVKKKDIPLEEFYNKRVPHNLMFVTVIDENDDVRFIFIVKDRANIKNKENTSVDFIVIFGEGWTDFVSCKKAKACIMDVSTIETSLKILKNTRSTVHRKYIRRIEDFALKKKVPYFDYCGTIPKKGHG